MEWSPKLFFFLILAMLLTFFIADVSYQSFLAQDIDESLENSIKGGMQQSINKGHLRVYQEMTIDSEKFKGFYGDLYAKNQSVNNAQENTVFYTYSELPPMLALRVTGGTTSFFKRAWADDSDAVTTNTKEIVIIEKIK